MKQKTNLLALLLALMIMLSACAGKTPDANSAQTPDGSNSQKATENNEHDAPAQSEGEGQEQENDPEQGDMQDPSDTPEQDSPQEQDSTQNQNNEQASEEGKSYEEYLSALSLFALSMEYPDFQLQGIYAASSVAVADKAASKGIYVFFDSMGESLCVRVTPIEAERTEAGSLDVYANELGYAAFELQVELPATDGLNALDSKVYGPLLSELNGVSLYNH